MSETIAKGIINYRNSLLSSLFNNEKITEFVQKDKIETNNNKKHKDVIFKVQLLASSKSIRKSNFKNLNNISKSKEGKIYKYYYGNVKTYNEARKLKIKQKKLVSKIPL